MTNEQLLLQIGRMVGDIVREVVGESEERLSQQIRDVDERLSQQIEETNDRLKETDDRLKETDERLSAAIENVHQSIRHLMDETEKMSLRIYTTDQRVERIEGSSVQEEV